jgi:hypothetical protein
MQFVAGIFWRTLALIPNLQPLIKYGENYWHLYIHVCMFYQKICHVNTVLVATMVGHFLKSDFYHAFIYNDK